MSERDRRSGPRAAPPVLVVEHDEALRELLVTALEAAGHGVVAASNGAAALEEVRRHRPALILLDLTMPVMDGHAFMGVYRQQPEPRAPVVVCTAHKDPAGQCDRVGANDYLKKPFIMREVLAVVGAHLRARDQRPHWRGDAERPTG